LAIFHRALEAARDQHIGLSEWCQESRQHLASDSATARSARCPNTLPAASIGPTTTPQSLRHSIDPTSPKRHSDKTTARHGKCYRVRDGSSFDADLCSVSEGDSPNLLRKSTRLNSS